MVDEKVVNALRETNPWWERKFEIDVKERVIFKEIKPFLKLKQIIAVSGLRRVGKTYLFYYIIKELLKLGSPEKIVFFSFDDFEDEEISNVLDAYYQIYNKIPEYLFLDEVQKLENWHEKVKRIYDNYKIKIFISGSESLFIRKKTKESLAGRIFEFHLKPLSFEEYLYFKGFDKNPVLYKKELFLLFRQYIFQGGFPELINVNDRIVIRKYIRETIIEKVIFIDIPKIFKIDDPSILRTILDIIIENPGQIIGLNNMAMELGFTRQTLSKYLYYLEAAQLVRRIYNYSRNRSTSEKKLKKFYITFPCTAISFKEDEAYLSKIIENLLVIHTDANYFWRTPQKDEVDIILEKKNQLKPIEVKYGDKINEEGIKKFMNIYNIKKGCVITKDIAKKEGNIELIPVIDFILKNVEIKD